ncbi:MAG: hypothetical protein LBS91_04210 [Clostridiales Family XIII bacterium]|jgi:CobQ-like glutamine amidotransferase family enzyme|nr:hypothetical protein [Clostridiales Family XIII bacterium]
MNILWLWPDILNLHGDRGNVMALVRVCGLYGIEAKVTRVNRLADDFDFEGTDIALLGPGELAAMPGVARALSAKRAALDAYAESGGVLFATGTTGAALAAVTRRADGSAITGTGLLGMECVERTAVLGDDLVFRVNADAANAPDTPPICGIQIQMMDVFLEAGQAPFGEIAYGFGNKGAGDEGAARGGVIFTNALGPVLVKNPWLALDLIRRALTRKTPAAGTMDALRFDPDLFALELASAKAVRAFNETKEKPKRRKAGK